MAVNDRSIVLRSNIEKDRAITLIYGLESDAEHPWELVVRKYGKKRTVDQNKRYHAVCREISEQLFVDGKRYGPDTLKEHFKRLFIGTTDATLPDGTTAVYGISTTTLNVGQFADFMTKIDVWACEHGVIFEETRAMLNAYAEEARRWREREKKKEAAG